MTADTDAVIDALRAGHDDLAPFVRTLSPDQLRAPSAAADWDVAQVLGHLGSGAIIGLAALDAAVRGEPNPGFEANKVVWARWDAMTPDEKAAAFLESNEELMARYQGLDAATRAELRIDLGFLPQPVDVATAGRFRLNEFALHSWDVRVSFDPAATVRPEAVSLLLDMQAFMLGWLAKTGPLQGREVTLAVRLPDVDRRLGLRFADQASVIDASDDADRADGADATLVAPAEAWLRLVSGRLAPQHTPAEVSVTGALDLDTLRQIFPGF